METPDSDTFEIIGLTDQPVTVKDGEVVHAEPPAEQDAAAEMKAAVEADAKKEEANKEPEKAVDAAADKSPEETPAGDTDKAEEDEKPAEKKPDEEEKPEGEEKQEEKPQEAEPSEADKLVEEIGGVEVLKAVQPLVESIYNPDLTPSQRVEAVVKAMPEEQAKAIRNEFFWQAAEVPEVQEVLINDEEVQDLIVGSPVACEAFAQKAFGLPYAVLQHIVNQEKELLDDTDIEEIVAAAKLKADAPKDEVEDKPEKPKAEKPKEEKPKEVNAPDLTPEFSSILSDLSTDVDEIVQTAQLAPDPKDDATTKRLKEQALKDFSDKWRDAFIGDEKAAKALTDVRRLATKGSEKLARDKYPSLSKNARRVAAQLVAEVAAPLHEHRSKLQEKGKAVATKPKEVKETSSKKEPLPDINSPEFDKMFAEKAGG
jgi:hypothetical protein